MQRLSSSSAVVVGLLGLLAVLLCACVESETIEFTPDNLQDRYELLEACGRSAVEPVEVDDNDLRQMLEIWKDEFATLQGYDADRMRALVTVTAVSYFDSLFSVDYYFVSDWVYVPFSFSVALAEASDESAMRAAFNDAISQVAYSPLPSKSPIAVERARMLLTDGCAALITERDCEPVRFVDGALWYEPQTASGQPALRLRDEAVCCSGLAAGCQ